MEKEKRINWISLLIRIVIIFVFVLILIWIISKLVSNKKESDIFKNNINNMESAAIEYFKTVDLPQKKGENLKITLKEMIDKKLIVSNKASDIKSCDTKNSNAKITRESNNYLVEVTLKCGKEKDTKTSKFSFKDCKNCNQNADSDDNKDKQNDNSNTNNSSSNNNSSDNNSASNENNSVVYYEYVKETISYSKWMRGNKRGEDIENKNEYYSSASKTYYTLGYLTKNEIESEEKLSYTIKLDNVPNKNYYFTTINDSNYLTSGEESKYLNNKDSSIVDKKEISNISKNDISKYSLEEDNYTYELSSYYRKGSFYVDIDIVIKNNKNLKYNKENIIYVPIKVNIEFISNKVETSEPAGEYVKVPYYRYIERTRETVWSTQTSLDGYTKTGRTK